MPGKDGDPRQRVGAVKFMLRTGVNSVNDWLCGKLRRSQTETGGNRHILAQK